MMTPLTDAELIQRTLAGSRLAADQLAARYRPLVTRVASAALQNRDDALDVAQESLVYMVQKLGGVRDPERFAPWLRCVTLSLCADYRRRRGTRALGEPITVLNEQKEEIRFAENAAVRQALARLSDTHRTAVLLHHVGGWTVDEVAHLTEAPPNTVRSRLAAAKHCLRALWLAETAALISPPRKPMTQTPFALTETQTRLLDTIFPKARILSAQTDIEPWQPFSPRVRLALADGTEKTVDFRGDITPERAALHPAFARLNIPAPRLLCAPAATPTGWLTLCESARGENLSLWTLGGTPHRIRLATERAIEGIERLQGATDGLLADPAGARLPCRTLTDEITILTDDARWNADPWLSEEGKSRREWLRDPWFAAALARVHAAVLDIADPLVYTEYFFFFPQNYRIMPGTMPTDEPLGWPGDPQYQENPLAEFTYPYGHFGDPLLGLAMVWVQDCYPFVHTGFVEQFLWRRGVTKRQFAPRLALKALQMVAREVPVARPAEGGSYWDGLRGWVELGVGWM